MKPTKPITDPTFNYVDSASTDLRKTFARVRKELDASMVKPPAKSVVSPIKRGH